MWAKTGRRSNEESKAAAACGVSHCGPLLHFLHYCTYRRYCMRVFGYSMYKMIREEIFSHVYYTLDTSTDRLIK
jgi:hypothetical protein